MNIKSKYYRTARATMAFRSRLERFLLEGVEETGEELGRGAYGMVMKVLYRGLECAGKKIHKALRIDDGDPMKHFEAECSLLSQLRHPHIVQFLGIYFERGSNTPVLVMEYLPTTLASCLDRYGVLPEEISYSVLRDVALGLVYLHGYSPPIIHRDLSANNVLLTEGMTAKISDLGVAKMLNLTPAQITHMTQAPGTQAYMPPEALVATPRYSTKMDIFSYGVLIVHMLCGRWPLPTKEAVDCITLRGISESERREDYLQGIGRDHPFNETIQQCLNNNPDLRPRAQEVLKRVKETISKLPHMALNKVELFHKIERKHQQKEQNDKEASFEAMAKQSQRAFEQMRLQIAAKDEEIQGLAEKLRKKHEKANIHIVSKKGYLYWELILWFCKYIHVT